MKNLTNILDRVATELEARGLRKLAAQVDTIANTLDKTAAEGNTVGINDFCKRQLQKAHWTHVPSMEEFEKVRKATEAALARGEAKPGYAPFVNIVTLTTEEFPAVKSTIAKITDDNKDKLKTSVTKRTDEAREQEYEEKHFPADSDVEPLPAHHIDVILYTKEQLESENSNPTGADWDIISINSEPYEKISPPSLTTMLRNESGAAQGGSGHTHSDAEKEESKKYWSEHAQVGQPPQRN